MLEDKTFEIQCCRDLDNPSKNRGWYSIGVYQNQWELNRAWKLLGCSKKDGYRKIQTVHITTIVR